MRAIVYRGAGTEAFASGADISEFQDNRKDTETAQRYNSHDRGGLRGRPRVSQADGRDDLRLLHGRRDGLAMACDLRFAAEGSKFGIPAARLSIIYRPTPSRSSWTWWGPPTPRTSCTRRAPWTPRGAAHRPHPAAGAGRRARRSTTDDYLAQLADNAPLSLRGSKLTSSPTWRATPTRAARACAPRSARRRRARTTAKAPRAFLEKRRPEVPRALSPSCGSSSSARRRRPHRRQWHLGRDRRAAGAGSSALGHAVTFRLDPHAHRIPHARPAGSTTPASPPRRRVADVVRRRRSGRLPVGAPARTAAAPPALRRVPQGHHRRRAPERAGAGARAPLASRHAGSDATRSGRTAWWCPAATRRRWPHEVYGVPLERLAVVPEPIDLDGVAPPLRAPSSRRRPVRPRCWRWPACTRASGSTTCCGLPRCSGSESRTSRCAS